MKLKVILLTLSLLILCLSLSGAFFYYNSTKMAAVQQNHYETADKIVRTAAGINALFSDKRAALARLAAIDAIEEVLSNPTPAAQFEANEALENFGKAFRNSIFYLLDTSGKVVAASNRYTTERFVGKNDGSGPYFLGAVKGKPSLFLGLGVASEQPGIYLGQPVYDFSGTLIQGVVAAKFPVAEIRAEIKGEEVPGIVFLADPDNIIFASNRQDLENNFLWEPAPAEPEAITAANQFVPGPRPWSGLMQIDATRAVDREGLEFHVHHHDIDSLPGWNIIFLHDSSSFVKKLSTALLQEIGVTVAMALLAINILVFLLYLMANREMTRRKEAEMELLARGEDLETLVASRTLELQKSNAELLGEIEAHKKDSAKLAYSNKTMAILNRVLSIAQGTIPLQEFLDEFLQFASSFSELGLLPRGAIFLVEEDNPEILKMAAHYDLNEHLLAACAKVPFGKCICGRAAAAGKPLFVSHIDERHDITYDAIQPHGHYCIPVIAKDGQILGLYNVYTKDQAIHDLRIEELLLSIASVLASIIEYKKAAQKSKESHAKHRAITSTANDSIIMVNHLGLITFWNPAAARLFGFSRDEALGADMHQLITPERFRNKAAAGFKHFLQTGAGSLVGKTTEVVGLKKDGGEFPLELSISPVQQGNNWAAIGIIRDITERKNSEAEKSNVDQQLRQAQKMEAIGTLAGGIAHDFNNILSSILGYTELIKEDMEPTKTETLDDLDQVIKAGNRAKDLVKQILTFSRQTEDEIQPIQISLVVKEALKLLRASLPSNIEIKQMISDSGQTVLCEPGQIHQVIMNLCTNSYRAMREGGGTLEVRLGSFTPDEAFTRNHPDQKAAKYLRLTVTDTGQGIDPAIMPRIFDPYFSTNKKEDGTGLGLAVVHGIVAGMGGTIEVDSKLQVGTTFKIFLPLTEKILRQEASSADSEISQGSESILLVDDELPILQLEERMLNSLGYRTTCRTSSIEAIALFRNKPDKFDLVITDQSMPNMTGTQLAEAMVELRPDLPIILCTGYSELDIVKRPDGRGIQDILMKPVNKFDLSRTIRQVLDRDKKL